jgi:hypothetical protein
VRQLVRQSTRRPGFARRSPPYDSSVANPFGLSDPLAGFKAAKRSMLYDPMAEQRELMNALKPPTVYDPMAEHRALMDALKPPTVYDPMAEQRALMDALEPPMGSDPIAKQRELIEALKPRPVYDPIGEHQALIDALKPLTVYDPMAEHRELMESLKPPTVYDPMAEQRELMESLKLKPIYDPMGESRRVLSEFTRFTTAKTSEFDEPSNRDEVIPSSASLALMTRASLGLMFLSIAWTCAWMIANGASTEDVGGLLIDAFSLAAYYQERR